MRNWFVAFLAALWLLPSEAASVTKKIGVQDFTGVVAGGIYDVTLIRADVCSVEVTCEADMADDLRIAVKQGRLVLEIDQSGWSSAERKKFSDLRPKAVVRLPVLSYLEIGGACRMETSGRFDAGERFHGCVSGVASLSKLSVGGTLGNWDISGGASVRVDAKFDESIYVVSGVAQVTASEAGQRVQVETVGGASLRLDVSDASLVRIGAAGVPSVTVAGRTDSLTVECGGGGRVNAVALDTYQARVGCSGVASVELNVSGELDVSVTGGSRVTYSGDARIVSQSVSRTGSLRKR
jgi:hypothetical protein